MNIYKLIYDISKRKIQFFAIILLAGFLGINVNKLIETKYFFKVKTKFAIEIDNRLEENMNTIINNLENDYVNQLSFKDNYIITSKNKNLYEFKIYIKRNDAMEYEKELQEILKITNEYKKKYISYILFTKKNKKEELETLEENKLKLNNGIGTIEKIYSLKLSLIILENTIKSISEIYPIHMMVEKKISEDKIKINEYAMATLMIIFSIIIFITFIVIKDEYKKQIKKFK